MPRPIQITVAIPLPEVTDTEAVDWVATTRSYLASLYDLLGRSFPEAVLTVSIVSNADDTFVEVVGAANPHAGTTLGIQVRALIEQHNAERASDSIVLDINESEQE